MYNSLYWTVNTSSFVAPYTEYVIPAPHKQYSIPSYQNGRGVLNVKRGPCSFQPLQEKHYCNKNLFFICF